MKELKPCPFCGAPAYELVKGSVKAPDAFWDGHMRGEEYNYIMCPDCDVIMKCYDFNDPAVLWNQRAEPQEKDDGVIKCKDCKFYPRQEFRYFDDEPYFETFDHCFYFGENSYCSQAKRKGSEPDVRG